MQKRLKSLAAAALLAIVGASCGANDAGSDDSNAKVHSPVAVAEAFDEQGLELLRMLDLPPGYGIETVFLPAVDESDEPAFTVYVFDTVESLKKFLIDKDKVPQPMPEGPREMIEQDNVLVFKGREVEDGKTTAIDEALAALGEDP